MARGQAQLGELTDAINHFLKVTRSYWSGLFHCYEVEGLPRTNNDLEHVLLSCVIINAVSPVVRLPQPHWFYEGLFDSLPWLQLG
jgi:hypothetical protein